MTTNSRRQQFIHGKDPEQNVVEEGEIAVVAIDEETTAASSTVAAVATPVNAANETAPAVFTNDTEAIIFVNTTRRPYPVQPSTIQTATAYSLFSDPDAFSLDSVRASTHYISDSIKGKIWWDINGDGKRGDYSDESLNEEEYDYGIPNINNIYLVTCEEGSDETIDAMGRSTIFNDQDPKPQRQSLASDAGIYKFNELNAIPSGRYYVMYQAPKHWRMSANVLPLRRRKIVDEEIGTYYECVPEGGNGQSYSEKARETGDLDNEGYCARSIGCMHVGSRSELEDEFIADLIPLETTKYYQEVIQGDTNPNPYGMSAGLTYTGTKWVALPTPYFMDVGMTEAKWPLSSNQYADATITLEFPASAARRLEAGESSLDSLKNDFSSSQNFARSKNQKAMKKAIDKFLTDNIPLLGSGGKLKESEKFVEEGEEKESEIFAYEGIDLFYGKIEPKTKNKDAIGSSRHLRGSRQIQEVVEVIEVTYTFTTRGAYNPPPHEQLGYFVQNSINANPDKLSRSLREDPDLPFKDLSETSSTHLTVGPPPPTLPCKECFGIQSIQNADAGMMKEWATIPVILLSATVGALILLFLGRRLWKRRREVADSDAQGDMKTREFTTSTLDMEKEKLMEIEDESSKKRKKGKSKKNSDESSAESSPPTLREVKKNMRNPSRRHNEDKRPQVKKSKNRRSRRELD